MAITRIGNGTGVTGTGNISPGYPAGYTAIANDVAIVHINETVADTGEYTTPAGWTKIGTVLNEIGAIDGRSSVYLKKLTTAEALPTWTDDTVDQFVAFCEIYRGVDPVTPLDVAAVVSQDNNVLTFTPTGLSVVTAGAMAISSIGCPFNGGDINITTPQGFTKGTAQFTTSGSNVTAGSAYKTIVAPGAVTYPTWEKITFTGIGQWTHIAFALRPAVDAPPVGTIDKGFNLWTFGSAPVIPPDPDGFGSFGIGDGPFGGS
jgi:hypothetical protein